MSETGAPPVAPPTEPGETDLFAVKPISRLAIWCLVCGVAGLILPLVGIAGIILGIVAYRRLGSDDRYTGRGVAVAGICTGAGGLLVNMLFGLIVYSMFATMTSARTMIWNAQVAALHGQAGVYAETHDGYPIHIAGLAVDPDAPFPVHTQVRRSPSGTLRPGEVIVGDFDFADFDEIDDPAASLGAALDRLDTTEPYYQFGAWWFVRLEEPTEDSRIIFAWHHDPESGLIYYVLDDGDFEIGFVDDWSERWADHAAARDEIGWPSLPAPPAPGGASDGTTGREPQDPG